jgi:ABC-type amino acid transport substrate-binding protein
MNKINFFGYLIKILIIILGLCCLPLKAQELVVVFEHNPPYQMIKENGAGYGPVIEFAQQLVKYTDLDIKFEALPWARIIQKEALKPNRLILSISRTPSRESNFIWLKQIYRGEQYIWKKKNAIDPKNILVAMERNSHKADLLKRYYKSKNVYEFLDSQQALEALIKGHVQRYVGSIFGVHGKLTELGASFDSLERLGVFKEYYASKIGLYLALSKTSSELVHKQLILALTNPEMIKALKILIKNFETKEKALIQTLN